MGRDSAFMAVKDAIGGGESFFGDVKVIVENAGSIYVYDDIFVSVTYNIGYMQMDVDVMWDDDKSQVHYGILGLHNCSCVNPAAVRRSLIFSPIVFISNPPLSIVSSLYYLI